MNKGIFIVIDGTDGSGKTEQTKRLIARLSDAGHTVELADFPQYGKPSAHFVEKYLRGEYGALKDIDAYRASLFYALDRFEASFDIRPALENGTIIVSNRYVSANMGHQAGKIHDPVERERFLTWLKDLEYGILGIPKPDVNILLYIPPEKGQQFVAQKAAREYTQGKSHDIHEADIGHLRDASQAYLEVADREGWKVVDYRTEDPNVIKTLDQVHEEIWNHLVLCKVI